MKKIVNIVLGAMIFGFVGCGTTGTNPELEEYPQDNQNQQGVYQSDFERGVPEILDAPTGMEVDFINYNYNYRLLNDNGDAKNGAISVQNVYRYVTDINGQYIFENIAKEEYNGISDPQGNVFIQKNVQYVLSENEISSPVIAFEDDLGSDPNQVISYNYTDNVNYTLRYNKKLQKNSVVDEMRDDNNQVVLRCVVRNILSPLDLGESTWDNQALVVPTEIVNDINSRLGLGDSLNLNFGTNILQSYCGASDGTIVHRFRAAGIGTVLAIYVYPDNTLRYEITHRNSINASVDGGI